MDMKAWKHKVEALNLAYTEAYEAGDTNAMMNAGLAHDEAVYTMAFVEAVEEAYETLFDMQDNGTKSEVYHAEVGLQDALHRLNEVDEGEAYIWAKYMH